MNTQVTENTILPDFSYCTPFKQNIKLSEVLPTGYYLSHFAY